jgi:uncharacterized protein YqjF (DUF2071 family)
MATFLSAEWRNLLMANYETDPSLLKPFLPRYTELDTFRGTHYISLVGFLFQNTRVKGFAFPFHRTFEEVNLRFYVRYKEDGNWKRGVVFIKELVPRRMITFVANTIYRENYATLPMKHSWSSSEEALQVAYYWKVNSDWNYLKAIAEKESQPLASGTEEEFITEHYWGYTFFNNACTGEYGVSHPSWRVHPVRSYEVRCDVAALYGSQFTETLNQPPLSVFLAEGSPIEVAKGKRLFA